MAEAIAAPTPATTTDVALPVETPLASAMAQGAAMARHEAAMAVIPDQPAEEAAPAEGEAPPPGDAKPAEGDAAKTPDKLASRFAALTRQEQAVRKAREDLKSGQAEVSDYKAKIELAKTDPVGFLAAFGITLQQLQKVILEGPQKPTAEDQVQALREEMQAKETAAQKVAEAERTARIEKAVASTKDGLAKLAADGAKFPLASQFTATEVADQAFSIMERHYEAKKEVLSYEDAIGQIEATLRTVRDAGKPAEPAPAAKPGRPIPKVPAKTLTNSGAATRTTASRTMTMEERRQAAMRLIPD